MTGTSRDKIFGGIVLLGGTAIGGGMLLLPIKTGIGGFWPACLLITGCCIYMLSTLFVLLEANLYCKQPGANVISMAKELLGKPAEIVAWISYLSILYLCCGGFISAAGEYYLNFSDTFFDIEPPIWQGKILFVLIFASTTIIGGIKWTDWINRLLTMGLIASFGALLYTVAPHINLENLSGGNPSYLLRAIPIGFTAFTAHFLLPSLRTYLEDDLSAIKKVLIIGGILPLIFYLIWVFIIVALLPYAGNLGLLAIAKSANQINALSFSIKKQFGIVQLRLLVDYFSFFAVGGTFVGALQSLIDFIQDGLKLAPSNRSKYFASVFAIVPPILFAFLVPSGFDIAITIIGAFICITFCLLPPAMVWNARYNLKLETNFQVFGGKTLLILIMLIAVTAMSIVICLPFNLLPKPI